MQSFKRSAVMTAATLMALSVSSTSAQFGLAEVPPMGWSTSYAIPCKDVSADSIKEQVDLLVSSGLRDVGFKYVLVDDCWQARGRNELGELDADPLKFPNGFQNLADYVHNQSMLIGISSSAGTKSCAGFPGSLTWEEEDMMLWSSWGIDYFKYDNCNNQGVPAQQRYKTMADKIANSDQPIYYAINNYGNENVTEWAPAIAQSWRTGLPVIHGPQTGNSFYGVMTSFLNSQDSADFAGPGGWNDPDALVVGAVADMNVEEMKTAFALWTFAKAPLMLSADLNKLGNVNDTSSMAYWLNNTDMLAISQDRLGHQSKSIDNFNATGESDTLGYYVSLNENATTKDQYFALLIVNWQDENLTKNTTLDLAAAGMSLSQYDKCKFTDMNTGKETEGSGGRVEFETQNLGVHQHKAYKIKCSAF